MSENALHSHIGCIMESLYNGHVISQLTISFCLFGLTTDVSTYLAAEPDSFAHKISIMEGNSG